MGKQITIYDRIQAFVWLCDKGLAKEMIVKGNFSYTNSFPLEFYGITTLKKSDDGHTFVRIGKTDNIKLKSVYNKMFSPVTVIPPYEHIETIAVSDRERMDPKSLIREGRYLTIRVNLSRKKKDIIADFESLVNETRKYVCKSVNRDKGFKLEKKDIWDIYYMHRIDGLKFTKIARILSGEKGNPTYNPILEKHLKRIKRAYDMAEEIINTLSKEIKKGKLLMDV